MSSSNQFSAKQEYDAITVLPSMLKLPSFNDCVIPVIKDAVKIPDKETPTVIHNIPNNLATKDLGVLSP